MGGGLTLRVALAERGFRPPLGPPAGDPGRFALRGAPSGAVLCSGIGCAHGVADWRGGLSLARGTPQGVKIPILALKWCPCVPVGGTL